MGLNALGETVSRAVAWIRALPAEPAEGRHPLWEPDLYALILSYPTGAPAESRFETHRNYVDLQYTLAGAEIIEWAPRGSLANDGGYEADRDVLFHQPGPAFCRILKSAGYFSIHTPLDAHRPKIKAEGSDRVFKLVVKIPVRLFPAT